MIQARFTCDAIIPSSYVPDQRMTVYFHAAYFHDEENSDYSNGTPIGKLALRIDLGTPAATYFSIGKDYYLHFEAVVPRASI